MLEISIYSIAFLRRFRFFHSFFDVLPFAILSFYVFLFNLFLRFFRRFHNSTFYFSTFFVNPYNWLWLFSLMGILVTYWENFWYILLSTWVIIDILASKLSSTYDLSVLKKINRFVWHFFVGTVLHRDMHRRAEGGERSGGGPRRPKIVLRMVRSAPVFLIICPPDIRALITPAAKLFCQEFLKMSVDQTVKSYENGFSRWQSHSLWDVVSFIILPLPTVGSQATELLLLEL
jgi:hypothetical protein